MSSSTPETLTAAVLTVSDSSARGERQDLSGPAVARVLNAKFSVVADEVVPDSQAAIRKSLIRLCGKARLVVTTGGTGIAARDVTPEATRTVCTRLLEGVAERMRSEGAKKTPFAVRACCAPCTPSPGGRPCTRAGQAAATVMRDAFAQGWQITPHSCLECTRECRAAAGLAADALGRAWNSGGLRRSATRARTSSTARRHSPTRFPTRGSSRWSGTAGTWRPACSPTRW